MSFRNNWKHCFIFGNIVSFLALKSKVLDLSVISRYLLQSMNVFDTFVFILKFIETIVKYWLESVISYSERKSYVNPFLYPSAQVVL